MRLLSSIFLVFFLATPSFAEVDSARLLGHTDFWGDYNINLNVQSCAQWGEKILDFRAQVSRDYIFVRDTTLHFADGSTHYFWVNGWLRPGYFSRWIPVTTDGKCLTRINVRGHNNGNYGYGVIRFYGRMIPTE